MRRFGVSYVSYVSFLSCAWEKEKEGNNIEKAKYPTYTYTPTPGAPPAAQARRPPPPAPAPRGGVGGQGVSYHPRPPIEVVGAGGKMGSVTVGKFCGRGRGVAGGAVVEPVQAPLRVRGGGGRARGCVVV